MPSSLNSLYLNVISESPQPVDIGLIFFLTLPVLGSVVLAQGILIVDRMLFWGECLGEL